MNQWIDHIYVCIQKYMYIHISSLSIHVRSHRQNLPVKRPQFHLQRKERRLHRNLGFYRPSVGTGVHVDWMLVETNLYSKSSLKIETVSIRYTANENAMENTNLEGLLTRWDCFLVPLKHFAVAVRFFVNLNAHPIVEAFSKIHKAKEKIHPKFTSPMDFPN